MTKAIFMKYILQDAMRYQIGCLKWQHIKSNVMLKRKRCRFVRYIYILKWLFSIY